MMYRILVAAIFVIAASFVSAQVEVVDRKIPAENTTASGGVAPAPVNNTAELYYQVQVLQQEVLTLRGMLERQGFEIKKLKQQRLDDYLDLDRRISLLSQRGAVSGAVLPARASAAVPKKTPGNGPNEMKHYRSAINLVLKEQRYDEAIIALKKHLEDFPTGRFTVNAKYWLGEVYLEKKELEKARQWFSSVIGEHPEHNKVPDSQYKLGVVYHLLGDLTTAKSLLEKVSHSNSNASRLADSYLKDNF